MSRHWNPRVAILAGALSLALPSGQAGGQAEGERQQPSKADQAKAAGTEQARAALKEMSTTLASAKTLRFKTRSFVPLKIASGAWVTLIGGASVKREGKDKLAIETGGDLFPFRFIFDGKTVTAFAPNEKLYAQREAQGTIDEVLDRAAKSGEATFVFADLVSANPYAAMTKGLQSAMVVGSSTIDGVETRHLAVHGKVIDWEIWIGTKDRLPRMVTLTDTRDPRKPTQTVQLSEWALDESLPPGAFAFEKPADATEVPFRNPRQAMASARRGPPAQRPRDGGTP
jgi:hypothetical protein